MESSSEASDISDSEIDDYMAKSYSCLKAGKLKVKYADSNYRCPFCAGKKKQDYHYKDLLQHAIGLGASNRSSKVKAKHRALANFLKNDVVDSAVSLKMTREQEPPHKAKQAEKYVWPWMGILVNVPRKFINGKYVGETGTRIKKQLCRFNPLKVHDLWNSNGHTGKAIVDFSKDWTGFNDAMAFEKFFEAEHLGKKDWDRREHHGSYKYGWVARDDDYYSKCRIGDHLQNHGDLKTIAGLTEEDNRKNNKLVANLTNRIEVIEQKRQELECERNTTKMSLDKVMDERDRMHHIHNEEIWEMRNHYRDRTRRIIEKSEKMRLEMAKELDDNKKKLATSEQKRVDGKVLRLVEEHKRENEFLLKRMLELERQQDARQKLELEIEQMKGQLQVMKHMEEDSGTKKKMEELKQELDDKIEDLDSLEDNYQTLVVKERMSNDELQDVRKALIAGLRETQTARATIIGIKRMGALDGKPFLEACKQRFPEGDHDMKALEFCSKWEEELKDPAWHPYKRINVDGKDKEVIDEDDERLRGLKNELGDDVYMAVSTALLEINEYNPSGRYVVPEFWHFKEQRKASPGEVVQYVFKQLKTHKRKRN